MNGILVVNKPLGYTSRDIVNIVGKHINTRKIGHTGTLDPNASGVLVLCIGQALKTCELLTNHNKEYVAEIILGIETDTLDTDNNATVLNEIDVNVDDQMISEVVNSFKGTYMQEVPKYSSVKVNGRKLYEYARNNIPVILPKKEVEINDISVISKINRKNGKVYFTIKTTVGKGTYIRSLVRDIGKKLNVPAVMNKLTRTKLGVFTLNDAYSLDDIKNNAYKLTNIIDAFPNIVKIIVDEDTAFKVKNGVIFNNFFDNKMAFILDSNNNLLALYKKDKDKCRPYKVFI